MHKRKKQADLKDWYPLWIYVIWRDLIEFKETVGLGKGMSSTESHSSSPCPSVWTFCLCLTCCHKSQCEQTTSGLWAQHWTWNLFLLCSCSSSIKPQRISWFTSACGTAGFLLFRSWFVLPHYLLCVVSVCVFVCTVHHKQNFLCVEK